MDEKEIKLNISQIFHEYGHYHRGEWAVTPKKTGPMIEALAALFEREMADETTKALDSYIIQLDACKKEMEAREGRVLWEGHGEIHHDYLDGAHGAVVRIWFLDHKFWSEFRVGEVEEYFGKHWQHVKVKIEEVPEKQAEIEKATDVDL